MLNLTKPLYAIFGEFLKYHLYTYTVTVKVTFHITNTNLPVKNKNKTDISSYLGENVGLTAFRPCCFKKCLF